MTKNGYCYKNIKRKWKIGNFYIKNIQTHFKDMVMFDMKLERYLQSNINKKPFNYL